MLCCKTAEIGRARQYLICSRSVIGIDRALSSIVLLVTAEDAERINGVVELLHRWPSVLTRLRANRKRIRHLSITHRREDVL